MCIGACTCLVASVIALSYCVCEHQNNQKKCNEKTIELVCPSK